MNRANIYLKLVFFSLAELSISSLMLSQNLVPNPSFETYTSCPPHYNWGDTLLQCTPWQVGSNASSDYFNVCANGTNVWIPDNFGGTQKAHTGKAYAGIITLAYSPSFPDYREYLQVQLTQPCLAGYTYEVSFYVNLADYACGNDNIGLYFSSAPPPWGATSLIDVLPQVESIGIVTDYLKWTLISGCFTALGGEQWITIGNFHNDGNTQIDPFCVPTFLGVSYYYVDDVLVRLADPNGLNLELGDTVITCVPYEIDPGVSGVDYHWSDGSTDPTLVVTETGTYSLTITIGCSAMGIDSLEVFFEGVPEVDLGPPEITICNGDSYTISPDPAIGDYLWQDSSTASTLLISQSGTYSLTVTNQCGSASDSITVHYTDSLAMPDLGPDVSLCPGETFTFYADVPGVNYTWQDSSTADSLVVTLPGTYFLQISNMCSSTSDTVIVTMNNNLPMVDLPSRIDLCSGDTIMIDAGVSGVQYLWNDGSQTSSISVSHPGVYSIAVSNACGVDTDKVVIVDAGPAPSVSLNADLSICPGEAVLLSPVSTDVISWLWQDGSTASTYTVSSAGIVSVQVSNLCGIDKDTMQVSLLPSTPALDLGADTSLCPGEILTLSINIPGVDFLWPDGSTGPDYNVTNAGLVHASISNQCGTSSDSLDVILLPPAPKLDLGIDQSLCPGDSINLSPGISGVDYLWQDGSTSSDYNAIVPGLIILIVTNSCGADIDTMEIIENTDSPEVSLGEDILACEGDVVTLSADISGVDYLWQDGSTQSDFSTVVSGTFILQVSNACGMDADTVVVDISGHIPAPALGPDTVLCEGFLLPLISNADAETSIEWQDGSSLPVFYVSSPGTYILSEANHCGNASDTINITLQTGPELFDLGPDTTICPGDFLVLTAPVTSDVLSWQDGSQANSIVADEAKIYSLTISNACGTVEDELLLSLDMRVPVLDMDPEIILCNGDRVILDATQEFPANYIWSTGANNSIIEINHEGHYIVTVSTLCQSAEREIQVTIENCTEELSSVFIPNVFSPNDDGVNDEFSISVSNRDILALSCSIFDRWGNLVFNSNKPDFKWKGTVKNALLSPGVYIYIISMEWNENGKLSSKLYSGDVTLVL